MKLHIVNMHQMAYAHCTTQKYMSPIKCLRIRAGIGGGGGTGEEYINIMVYYWLPHRGHEDTSHVTTIQENAIDTHPLYYEP